MAQKEKQKLKAKVEEAMKQGPRGLEDLKKDLGS